jgi:hypothetical protein
MDMEVSRWNSGVDLIYLSEKILIAASVHFPVDV